MSFDLLLSNLMILNNSKILSGVMLLLMNFGSRFVVGDLSHTQNAFLSSEFFKFIIIYAIFFVGTRDIFIAFAMALIYIILVDGILNEKRRFCIIPNKYIVNPSNVSSEDYAKAKKIIENYESRAPLLSDNNTLLQNDIHYIYKANLNILQRNE